MTEEIIKECEFYLPLSEDCNEILDDNGNEIYKCSSRQECYYKQLIRLEQENRELKDEIQFHNKENSNLLAERNAAQIGYDEIREVRERYRSALEEIREILKFYADTWVDEKIYPNLHYDNTKAKEGLSRINEVLQ